MYFVAISGPTGSACWYTDEFPLPGSLAGVQRFEIWRCIDAPIGAEWERL